MLINKVETKCPIKLKITITILGFYFCVVLPCIQIFLRMDPYWSKHSNILFFAFVVIYIAFLINPTDLGFSTKYFNQHIVLGLISGGALLLSIVLLNYVLNAIGLASNNTFSQNIENEVTDIYRNILEKIGLIIVVPFIEQIFFSGLALKSLLERINPIIAIYIISVIYTLIGLDLTLGTFALGIIASTLFKITGTLYSSIIFHMSCVVGGEIIFKIYPKLIVILGFLF